MKRIYFVQPNNVFSNSSNLPTAVHLPYAAGTIAAYSFSHEEIRQNYTLCDFIFKKDPVEDVLQVLVDPFMVAFSNYMWNIEYNLELAREVKEKWPACIILFGGVQIPDDTQYLENYPFIDILIHGEGEVPFYKLLVALENGTTLDTVPVISYRKNGVPVQTVKEMECSLDQFPSPYTMGLFDYIIRDPAYAGVQFDTVLETNRGCPYSCVYCVWGANKLGFRTFPLEKIKAEIDWMATNAISYCFCADSNFGILERDEAIADYIIECKNKYGYPQKFETLAAKNKDDLIFRLLQKLEAAGLNRGISIAVQSMSEEVLEKIGRKNMSLHSFAHQVEKYRVNGMHTYTDLILALPGETLESFCKGLCEVIEAGQHNNISVYRCEFFPNTIMHTKEFVEKYKIRTQRSLLSQTHTCIDADMRYASRSDIVVETSTMSAAQWKEASRFAICVQSFHSLGLLKYIAIYLRKSEGISYYDFYMNLYKWIENESVIVKRILDTVCESFDVFLKGEGNLHFADERFGNIFWDFYEGLFLCCATELDVVFDELKTYLKKVCGDKDLFEELFYYQKEMIALPGKEEKQIRISYDWKEYFENIFNADYTQVKPKEKILKINRSSADNWVDYAHKNVWYGKRLESTLNKPEEIHS
ncbi:MAG: radical SAM protein [Ruminococcaceae bacterium]|nr:radical SAM protein [Oscillospiraceae bacterium]